MGKQGIPNSQIKLLWGASAGRCAICREKLIDPTSGGLHYHIGEMAHEMTTYVIVHFKPPVIGPV